MEPVKMNWGGRDRICYPKVCEWCESEFHIPMHVYDKSKFCSRKCAYSHRRSLTPVVDCGWCGIGFRRSPSKQAASRTGNVFCSRVCKESAQRDKGKSFSGFLCPSKASRKARRSGECSDCGYSEVPAILVGHHVDGDRSNNCDENLVALCPNCHAIRHLVGGVVRFSGGVV